MFWTREEKARYLAKKADEALKEGKDLEEALLEALECVERAEKGSGESGL